MRVVMGYVPCCDWRGKWDPETSHYYDEQITCALCGNTGWFYRGICSRCQRRTISGISKSEWAMCRPRWIDGTFVAYLGTVTKPVRVVSTCACGSTGRYKVPGICAKCKHAENRTYDANARATQARYYQRKKVRDAAAKNATSLGMPPVVGQHANDSSGIARVSHEVQSGSETRSGRESRSKSSNPTAA